MRKILPILLALFGLGAGVGAGLALRPAAEPEAVAGDCLCDCGATQAEFGSGLPPGDSSAGDEGESTSDFVKLTNQLVIPVVHEDRVAALVVMSLSLEIAPGQSEEIYKREPRLRDNFLQVLFDHANTGGFDGAFTTGPKMKTLRQALLEVARRALGTHVRDILITDIARQDM